MTDSIEQEKTEHLCFSCNLLKQFLFYLLWKYLWQKLWIEVRSFAARRVHVCTRCGRELRALLSFQFWTSELHRCETGGFRARAVGLVGLLVGLGVPGFCIWRLVRLLFAGS